MDAFLCQHQVSLQTHVIKDSPLRQCSDEKRNDRDDFMVARNHKLVEVEG